MSARLRIGAPVGLALLALAGIQAVVALLFLVRAPVVDELWPIPGTGDMTFILMASFFAASAASTAWAVLWGEPGSLVGIALDYVVIFAPLSILAIGLDRSAGGGSMPFIAAALGGAVVGVAMLWWSWRRPLGDPMPTPAVVRGSFVVFLVALLLAGLTLIGHVPQVMPWPLTPDLSVITGLMFLGAASYFGYGLVRPRWTNAGGQLAGFLAYDVVLDRAAAHPVRVPVLRMGHESLGVHAGHRRQRHPRGVVPAPGPGDPAVPGATDGRGCCLDRGRGRCRPRSLTEGCSASVPAAQVLTRDALRGQVCGQTLEVLDAQVDLAHPSHEADRARGPQPQPDRTPRISCSS